MLPDEASDPRTVAAPGPAQVPSQHAIPRPGTDAGVPGVAQHGGEHGGEHGGLPGSQPRGARPSLRALGVQRSGRPASARTDVPRCTAAALRTVHGLVLSGDADPRALAHAVESDPVLCLRVLHRANAGHRPGGAVDTVPQALAVLGATALEGLARELASTAVPNPMPGLARVLTRALACEELAADRAAFTVGLLSGLASELGVPEELVVQVAGVSQEAADAVRLGRGPLGRVLHGVLAYEASDPAGLARSGLAVVDVYDTYLRSAADAMATAAALGAVPGGTGER